MENNKKYLFCGSGVMEAPDDWYFNLKDEVFTNTYEGILEGKYMHLSDEQLKFNLENPGLELYNAFYMILPDPAEINEKIRNERRNTYSGKTDKLYMAYVKYREFGQDEKAIAAYNEWKQAVQEVKEENPYLI